MIAMSEEDKLLTVPEAARRLGVSGQTMQRMIDDKEIAAYKIRLRWRVPQSAVTRYLQESSNHGQREDEQ